MDFTDNDLLKSIALKFVFKFLSFLITILIIIKQPIKHLI